MKNIIGEQLQQYRNQIGDIIERLYQLTVQIGHQGLQQTLTDLKERVQEPFMFVIVGEVKAGKSSFINALLDTGREITKVAAMPMTDTIQQIIYGEEEEVIEISPYLKRILQPVEILKEIAIVDTPGTNTIVEHHQEITERFIPAADLIIFVFEAKNPYRQSSWTFFDFIREEWHKKIIFVLQQKDLLPADDLHTNEQGLKEYAEKKNVKDPLIFSVSAKQEQEGEKEASGFAQVRDYIREHITGGRAPLLKLSNNIETGRTILQRIMDGLATRKEQWAADTSFRNDIRGSLEEQSRKSENQVDILVENLLAAYDRITRHTESEINNGLSFFPLLKRSIGSVFTKQPDAKAWLTEEARKLEENLNRDLKDRLNDGVVDIADSIQQMARMIDLKLKNSRTILKDNHDIFSDIAERRANVLKELQETFAKFLRSSENFTDDEVFAGKENISPNIATGSGIAIIGVILATVTNGMVFDITGGILTTIGLLFAGVTVGLQRRKIMKGYRAEIEKGRQQLEYEVSGKLKTYIGHIRDRIDDNFAEFDRLLELEAEQIKTLETKIASIGGELDGMEKALR